MMQAVDIVFLCPLYQRSGACCSWSIYVGMCMQQREVAQLVVCVRLGMEELLVACCCFSGQKSLEVS